MPQLKLESLGLSQEMVIKFRKLLVKLERAYPEFLVTLAHKSKINFAMKMYESEVTRCMHHMLSKLPQPYQEDDITAAFIVSVKMLVEYAIWNADFVPMLANRVEVLNRIEGDFLKKINFYLPPPDVILAYSPVELANEALTEINCIVQLRGTFRHRHLDAKDIVVIQTLVDRLHKFGELYEYNAELKQKMADLEEAFGDLKSSYQTISSTKRWDLTLAFLSKVKILVPILEPVPFAPIFANS